MRVNSDGSTDNSFGPAFSQLVQTIALQSDGKILIGGYFTSYDGLPINRVARLNSDGTIDSTFNAGSGANDFVYDIAFQADGKILLGGAFTFFNNQPRAGSVRLNATAAPRKTFFDFDGDGKSDLSVFRPSDGVWYLNRSTQGFAGIQFGEANDNPAPNAFVR